MSVYLEQKRRRLGLLLRRASDRWIGLTRINPQGSAGDAGGEGACSHEHARLFLVRPGLPPLIGP